MTRGALRRIVSGGQTGVDRAALEAARTLGIPMGGWCPADRGAEDGPIDPAWPLRETPSDNPAQRTEWNVRDSDATLILSPIPLTGGTALTRRLAQDLARPCLVVDPHQGDPGEVAAWLERTGTVILNVAGPRQGKIPGVYELAAQMLIAVLGPGEEPADAGV